MAVLSDRINQLRDSSSSSSGGSITGSGGVGVGPSAAFDIGAPERSFSDAEDDELSAALSQRVSQIASATGSWSEADESEMRQPLTGEVRAAPPCSVERAQGETVPITNHTLGERMTCLCCGPNYGLAACAPVPEVALCSGPHPLH